MLFPPPSAVDEAVVRLLLRANWGLILGNSIKKSQNCTFAASNDSGLRFVARVTPDADGEQRARIADEVEFVSYAATCVSAVVAPVKTVSGQLYLCEQGLVIVVSPWAKGEPVDFMALQWFLDAPFAHTWGATFAALHATARTFAAKHPIIVARIRRYDALHDGVLASAAIDPLDAAVMSDPAAFSIIHGDFNVSNFFYGPSGISVFDWDQLQLGWWEWDLAQPLIGALMLQEAGIPVAGTPVPQATAAAMSEFTARLVEGYESVAGPGSIDRQRLARMLTLRKTFYASFCRRAVDEGDIPADMAPFIQWVVKWVDTSP